MSQVYIIICIVYRIAGFQFSRRLYFARAQPIFEKKIVGDIIIVGEARFSIYIREITFREQELAVRKI